MVISFKVRNAQAGLQGFSRKCDSVPRIGDKIRVEKREWVVTDVIWEENDERVYGFHNHSDPSHTWLLPIVEIGYCKP